jgi:hypothetical protein
LAHLQNVRLHIPSVQNRRYTGIQERPQVPFVSKDINMVALPTAQQMDVHVGQSRYYCLPRRLNYAGTGWYSDCCRGPDGPDERTPNNNCGIGQSGSAATVYHSRVNDSNGGLLRINRQCHQADE